MREALVVQALEEVDGLLVRVETLLASVSGAESSLNATTESLQEAGDKYRMAVTAFTEQAKADLTEHLQRKASEHVAATVEEQRGAMQEAARIAFRSQASDDAASLAKTLRAAAGEFQRAAWARMAENLVVALLSSSIVAGVTYALLRGSGTA
ncbi:hypothetical protein SAMN03159475_0113 [Pseudomonas sp. NFPP33]|nr:hypothetical protein [Pseudomonas sp. NFPP33]SDA85343.1 hypothetical protein SAMN03159475_0113 [Pseudomonas sp. NFPP33]